MIKWLALYSILGSNFLLLLHLLSLAMVFYCRYFCEGYENPAHILSQLDIWTSQNVIINDMGAPPPFHLVYGMCKNVKHDLV